jgi:hypothetical protein
MRRAWRKLYLSGDAGIGRIVALTGKDDDDAAQIGALLDQVTLRSLRCYLRRCATASTDGK